jgi:endonuclease/exonuclease/phosphatase family metal-dependent hydrolase/uncharacterized protein (UPF0248 family)
MRTSEQLYHQVRWDPRFDPARFVLGVSVRGGRPPQRLPLAAFVPGGDVPWHRIVFVEADGELVWDRSNGLDRIEESTVGRVEAARRLRAPFFTARVPHAWDPGTGTWLPAPRDRPDPPPGPVRLLTWNALWDRYDSDRIHTARRRPLLLAELVAADADVIALQEVEPALLALLLAQPWVRTGYTLDADPTGPDVDDTGLVLLSRLPVTESGRHALGPHKGVAAITVRTAAGPLVVATTHLTSDHAADGAERREHELTAVAGGLAALDGDVVLMGDLNDGSDHPAAALRLRDAWPEARGPGDDTPTFDPTANPLATVSSLSGRPARLDRVLLRGPGLVAMAAGLRGDGPAELPPSDHYGVQVDVVLGGAEAAREGVEPPTPLPDVAPVVDALRAALAEGVVEIVGSRRTGCALPGADLDLVAALPGRPDPADVAARVRAVAGAAGVRQVVGSRVPGVRFRVGDLAVDLVIVPTGDVPPHAAVRRRAELGEAAAVALSAVSDAEAVLAAVGPRTAAFTALATAVKAWARARGLDSAPHGGLPGIAWAVLVARTLADADTDVHDFFARWAVHDWRHPVALDPVPFGTSGALTVLTPSAPVRSCTEQVTAGFRDLLAEELYRAWELTDAGVDPAELCAPPPLHLRHAAWALLTAHAATPAALADLVGRLRGRTRALLGLLDGAGVTDAHAWPRPVGTGPASVSFAVGLGRTPPDPARLSALTAEWARGVPGVRIEHVVDHDLFRSRFHPES